ncbi:MAG: CopD family protein [Gammaproteobacteria bacterium]|jgi:uncharacterized membrane protein
MNLTLPLALHVLSVTIWVGGMFFAYMALRPVATSQLQPPERLRLWAGTFAKFFPWVWVAVVLILATGYWMLLGPLGGMKAAPPYVHIMNGIGILMMLIYFHVFFAPYKRLRRAVAGEEWKSGGVALGQIRKLIGLNLSLGLINIVVATLGRSLF